MTKEFKLFNVNDFKVITDKMTECGIEPKSDEKNLSLYFESDIDADDDSGFLVCGVPYAAINDVEDDCDVKLPGWMSPIEKVGMEYIMTNDAKYGTAAMREQFDKLIDEEADLSAADADIAFKMAYDIANKNKSDEKNDDDEKSDDNKKSDNKKSKKGTLDGRSTKGINLDFWASLLISQYNAKLFNDNLVYTYSNGGYNEGVLGVSKILAKLDNYLTEKQMGEITHRLDIKLRGMLDDDGDDIVNCACPDSRYIRFKHKIYDTQTKQLIDPSPKLNVVNRIRHDYDPNAPVDDDVEKFLEEVSCGREGIRKMLIELLGYILYFDNPTQKIFMMVGDGANGKTTYEKVIKRIIGSYNYSSVKMKDFDDKYRPAEMVGKLCNIGDDIGDGFIKDASNLKVISGDGEQQFERKFQCPFDYRLKTKLMFSSNKLPRVNDKTHGWMRRIVIIPFAARFSADDDEIANKENTFKKDSDIDAKLQKPSAIKYWLRLAIEGLHDLMDRGFEFDITDEMKDALSDYEEYNNPAVAFINEMNNDSEIYPMGIEGFTIADLYNKYKTYCADEGLKPLSKIEFNKQVRAMGYDDSPRYDETTGKKARKWFKVQ